MVHVICIVYTNSTHGGSGGGNEFAWASASGENDLDVCMLNVLKIEISLLLKDILQVYLMCCGSWVFIQ